MMKKHAPIDISKNFFAVHTLEDHQDIHFEYAAGEVGRSVQLLAAGSVELIVMDATGGYPSARKHATRLRRNGGGGGGVRVCIDTRRRGGLEGDAVRTFEGSTVVSVQPISKVHN